MIYRRLFVPHWHLCATLTPEIQSINSGIGVIIIDSMDLQQSWCQYWPGEAPYVGECITSLVGVFSFLVGVILGEYILLDLDLIKLLPKALVRSILISVSLSLSITSSLFLDHPDSLPASWAVSCWAWAANLAGPGAMPYLSNSPPVALRSQCLDFWNHNWIGQRDFPGSEYTFFGIADIYQRYPIKWKTSVFNVCQQCLLNNLCCKSICEADAIDNFWDWWGSTLTFKLLRDW